MIKIHKIKPKEEEIDEVLNDCATAEDEGESQYPGMTYEQGVKAGIEWIVGQTDSHPLKD